MTQAEEFVARAEQHRRELHVHCYRMLASFDEAEDAVQETMLRAWRARATIDVGMQFRAWLYRIATNVCLDALRRSGRRPAQANSGRDVSWLQPYPDPLLDEIAPSDEQPDAQVVERETIELAFVAAMQVLPPRQRAALIARDVLGWSANETAAALDTSVAAANSALQRARETMQDCLPERRADWTGGARTEPERELLARFIDAHERCDAEAAIAIAAQELTVTMPPYPWLYVGLEAVGPLIENAFGPGREGDWRLRPTAFNRMPAAGSYLRRYGDTTFRAFKLDLLRIHGDRIVEITTFGPALFAAAGLPAELPADTV